MANMSFSEFKKERLENFTPEMLEYFDKLYGKNFKPIRIFLLKYAIDNQIDIIIEKNKEIYVGTIEQNPKFDSIFESINNDKDLEEDKAREIENLLVFRPNNLEDESFKIKFTNIVKTAYFGSSNGRAGGKKLEREIESSVVLALLDVLKNPDSINNLPEENLTQIRTKKAVELIINFLKKHSFILSDLDVSWNKKNQEISDEFHRKLKDIFGSVLDAPLNFERWNPSDIWIYSKSDKDFIISELIKNAKIGLSNLNDCMIDLFNKKLLVGISLKAESSSGVLKIKNLEKIPEDYYTRFANLKYNNRDFSKFMVNASEVFKLDDGTTMDFRSKLKENLNGYVVEVMDKKNLLGSFTLANPYFYRIIEHVDVLSLIDEIEKDFRILERYHFHINDKDKDEDIEKQAISIAQNFIDLAKKICINVYYDPEELIKTIFEGSKNRSSSPKYFFYVKMMSLNILSGLIDKTGNPINKKAMIKIGQMYNIAIAQGEHSSVYVSF